MKRIVGMRLSTVLAVALAASLGFADAPSGTIRIAAGGGARDAAPGTSLSLQRPRRSEDPWNRITLTDTTRQAPESVNLRRVERSE